MTIFVVIERTGGWGGSETYAHAYYAFRERAAADAYVEKLETRARETKTLWDGEIHEVTLE